MFEIYPVLASLWGWLSFLAIIAIIALAVQVKDRGKIIKDHEKVEKALREERDKYKYPDTDDKDAFPKKLFFETHAEHLQRVWHWLKLKDYVDGRIASKEVENKIRQGTKAHEDAQSIMQRVDETMERYGRTASFPNARPVTQSDIFPDFSRSRTRFFGDSTTRGRAFGVSEQPLWELRGEYNGLRYGTPHYTPKVETLKGYHCRLLAYALHRTKNGWSEKRAAEFLEFKWIKDVAEEPKTQNFSIFVTNAHDGAKKITDFHLEMACGNKEHHVKHEWTSRRKNTWHCPGK